MESVPREQGLREERSSKSHAPPECDVAGYAVGEAANDMQMSQLARTIEQEIIPRLMLAHRAHAAPITRASGTVHAIGPEDVRQFARLVLSHEEDVAFAAVELWRSRVDSVEKIYMELLAPTARYLGELWTDDLCSFTDVTVGLGRLQRVLRELSPALGRSVDHPLHGRRVLLLPSPGEQHTFGLVMVAEFFRLAGWDVTGGAWSTGADAASMAGAEWFDAIGFSMGAEIHLRGLTDTIAAVRHATCNRDLVILVGGPMFVEHPDWVARLGADAMTIDGREAPVLAERLISGLRGQRDMHG
jgi:methanogenic corrinoid protein MtbC1